MPAVAGQAGGTWGAVQGSRLALLHPRVGFAVGAAEHEVLIELNLDSTAPEPRARMADVGAETRSEMVVAPAGVPAQRAQHPRAPGGVAAFVLAHNKTPRITPSMEFPAGKGVARGRGVQQLAFALPATRWPASPAAW